MSSPATPSSVLLIRILILFYFSLSVAARAADEKVLGGGSGGKKGYIKGDSVPVSCLNRTIDTGEHIKDSLGNLQYIPFPTCNETGRQLAFAYDTPAKVVCTIAYLEDELYHLLEYFVHSDVPLTCRVPTYPLQDGVPNVGLPSSGPPAKDGDGDGSEAIGPGAGTVWTPLNIALQGALQHSHLHIHTAVNVLFHTSSMAEARNPPFARHLIGATAYSLPNLTDTTLSTEGTKVLRTEPLIFTFNAGWIDGDALPGMIGRPAASGVKDHGLGFTLLSFSALAASAGLGAMAMMIWERKKSRRSLSINGLSSGGARELGMNGHSGYGGYGRYGVVGKRD